MTDEDCTAAKLKGYTCLIKFKDGEELLLKDEDLLSSAESREWFIRVERFLNFNDDAASPEYFPSPDLAISRDTIKYVTKL